MMKISSTFTNFLKSAAIILIFLYLGKGITAISGLPIPGAIFGLLLLFLALNLRFIRYHTMLPASSFLLSNMTLFFVPVGVGLLQYGALLSQHWLAITASSVLSTVVVLLVVGHCYQRLTK